MNLWLKTAHNISFQWRIFSSCDSCGPNKWVCICHSSVLFCHLIFFFTPAHTYTKTEKWLRLRDSDKLNALSKWALNVNHIGLFPEVICKKCFDSLWSNWELCYWISGQMVKQSVYHVITMYLICIRCCEKGERIRRHYSSQSFIPIKN